jgi:hypothetical protein
MTALGYALRVTTKTSGANPNPELAMSAACRSAAEVAEHDKILLLGDDVVKICDARLGPRPFFVDSVKPLKNVES